MGTALNKAEVNPVSHTLLVLCNSARDGQKRAKFGSPLIQMEADAR